MPADKNCKSCNGTGHIIVTSLTSKRCECLLKQMYSKKLGRVLYNVAPAKDSFLLDKLNSYLFMVVGDEDINPHLKASFIKLGLNARWIFIDDSNVLQAWLGKPNTAGAENLNELIEYPFMVLRLGVVGYQNKALSGVLCELLMGRVLGYKPTWIISPRELSPETCLEYSDELDNILRRYFEFNQRFKVNRDNPNKVERPKDSKSYFKAVEEVSLDEGSLVNPSANSKLTASLLKSGLWGKSK